jgi:uncharacterized protein (DUF362 family)
MTAMLNRRDFIKGLLAAGVASGVAACGSRPSPPTAASAVPPPTPGANPTATSLAPARASTAIPTTAPTAAVAQATAASPTAAAQLAATAPPIPTAGAAYLAVARDAGADPAELARRAIAAVGGIERFVKPGADVIVKPNICNAYHGPEYASTTNPQVVAAIVALCLGAGAKRVRVMDLPFGGTAQAAYAISGIEDAVKAAGGQMDVMKSMRYREIPIPQGRVLKKWKVYGDILDADTVINVPIAKNHGSAVLTLSMKNLMGVADNRNGMHARGLHQSIADLCTVVRPQLTVVDATRILLHNGPTGGNLADVKQTDTVIASADMVAADSYAATLFGMTGKDIDYIRFGAEMGLGQMDLGAIKVEEIAV